MDLVPNGSEIDVDSSSVYDYVRRYAEYRMIKHSEKCLQVSVNPSHPHDVLVHFAPDNLYEPIVYIILVSCTVSDKFGYETAVQVGTACKNPTVFIKSVCRTAAVEHTYAIM